MLCMLLVTQNCDALFDCWHQLLMLVHLLLFVLLLQGLLDMGLFEIISAGDGLPLVAFHLKDDPERKYDEFHVAERLRMYNWVVPAYTLAKDNQVS
jgi:hypothetical protein